MAKPLFFALTEDHVARAGPTQGTPYQHGDSFVFCLETTVFDADFYIMEGPGGVKVWLPAVILEKIDTVPWLTDVACAV